MRSGGARIDLANWSRRFLRAFLGLDARRLRRVSLIGLAIVLQAALDLPRDALRNAVGPGLGLLTMAALLGSIALIVAAVLPPRQAPPPRWLAPLALGLCCVAALIGARQVVLMGIESVTPVAYNNDGTTLDQYAAIQLLHGQDPYQTTNLIAAIRALRQPNQFATPLRAGAFAERSWLDYPTTPELERVLQGADPAHPPAAIESHVSYPALSFLLLVPFALVGLPSVVLFSLLCLALFAWFALRSVPAEWQPWLGLLILADVPVLNSGLAGALDVTTMLWLFLAWRYWERLWPALILFGLALATKQQAWFFIPFFAIFLWQRVGWRGALARVGGAVAVFCAINLPFIIHDAPAWVSGVLAPVSDPMFPRGQGLVQLALAGFMPLMPQRAYTVLEVLGYGAAVAWYWRVGARRYPELAFLLALAPLWFAWRSLTSYFYFSALPMIALSLTWRVQARQATANPLAESTEMHIVEGRA